MFSKSKKQNDKPRLYGIIPIQYVNNYFIYENSVYQRQKNFNPTQSYHFDTLLDSNQSYQYISQKISEKQSHLFIFLTLEKDYKTQLNSMAEFMLYFYEELQQAIDIDQKLAFCGTAYTENEKVLDLFSPVENLLELQNQRPFRFNLVSSQNLKAKLNACQVRLNLQSGKNKSNLLYKFSIINGDQQIAYEYAFALTVINQKNCLYLSYLLKNQFLQNIGKKYYNDLIPFIKSFDILLYVLDTSFNYAIYLNNLKSIKIDPNHQKELLMLIQEYYTHKEQLDKLNNEELNNTKEIIQSAINQEAEDEMKMTKSDEELASSTNQATHKFVCDEFIKSQQLENQQSKKYNKNIDVLKQNIDKIMQQSKYLSSQSKLEILQAQQSVINKQMSNETADIKQQFIQGVGKFKVNHQKHTTYDQLDVFEHSESSESGKSEQNENDSPQILDQQIIGQKPEENQENVQITKQKPEYVVFDVEQQKGKKYLFKEIIVPQYLTRQMNKLDYTRLLRIESFKLSNAEMEFLTQGSWKQLQKLAYEAKQQGVVGQSNDLSANQKFQPLLRFMSAISLQWQLQQQLILLLNQKSGQLFIQHSSDFASFLEQYYKIQQENIQKEQQVKGNMNVKNQRSQSNKRASSQQRTPLQQRQRSIEQRSSQQQKGQRLPTQTTTAATTNITAPQQKAVLLWGNAINSTNKNPQNQTSMTLAERLKQQRSGAIKY